MPLGLGCHTLTGLQPLSGQPLDIRASYHGDVPVETLMD